MNIHHVRVYDAEIEEVPGARCLVPLVASERVVQAMLRALSASAPA